jgi:DNA/RNA-binding domain of Phe-tRNA-synthetase-like protein
MNMLEYRISGDVFEENPGYCRGVVVVDAADNQRRDDGLVALLRGAEARIRDLVHGNVAEHPRVSAWRDAYRRFGAKPSEHRSSIEAMVRRVVKSDSLPSINPLVDIGNIVSLRYMLPAGVHPLPLPLCSLDLRRSSPGDTFIPADGGAAEAPPTGEIVLACGHDVLTRRWTWRQAANTQTLPDSARVFFNIDGLPPVQQDDVLVAMEDVIRLVQEYCGGAIVQSGLLTADHPALALAVS